MHAKKKTVLGALPTLFLLLMTVIAGCGGTTSQSANTEQKAVAPPSQQIFRWPLPGIQDLQTIDPAKTSTLLESQAINMYTVGLVSFDDKLNLIPELAQSWSKNSDATQWTFKLRSGLKFSDGDPITSHDFAYSIDRALQPSINSPVAPSYLNLIQDWDKLYGGQIKTIIGTSLTTPDDQTLTIKLNKSAAYFLQTLTYPTAYLIQKKLVDKYGDKDFYNHLNEGGDSGPFILQEYAHGKQLTFVPNPNYWGPKSKIQKVIMPFYKDYETAFQAYQNGQIDQAAVPTAHLNQVKNKPDYVKTRNLTIFYYGMNYLIKPFDNLNLRKAFALALNKDRIVKAAWHDVNIPTNHIVPDGMPTYNNPNLTNVDGSKSTQGNPAKAKEYLNKALQEMNMKSVADLPPIKFQYQANIADLDNEISIATSQWKENLGINVQATPIDFETLSTALNANNGNANGIPFYQSGWIADYPDPQDFLTLQFDKNSPNNQTNYGQNSSSVASAQASVQTTLNKADAEQDTSSRLKAYQDAEQKLVNDVAWISMYQDARSRVLKTYVMGRVFNAQDTTYPQTWGKVYIAAH